MDRQSIKIFIAGDVVPRNKTVELYKKAKVNSLFEDYKEILESSDINIVNFEAPIINGAITPIKKSGPNLFTSKTTLKTLKDAGFNCITLANNHFRDQGNQGVIDTINAAKEMQMDFVGGGENINDAKQIKYQICGGSSIDQVLAQWHADIIGLGDIYDKTQLHSALDAMMENNFKPTMRDFANPWRIFSVNDEAGTVICVYPENVEKAIHYIHLNFQYPINCSSVCEALKLNRTMLSGEFHQATGITMKEFILDLRLDKAKWLLEAGNLKIKDIAGQCGFTDPGYFIRVFRKYVKTSPAGFRKNITAANEAE